MKGYYEKFRDEMPLSCWETKENCCEAHFHSSIELVYVVKGDVDVTSGGQQYSVTSGYALLSPSYSLHTYKTSKPGFSINLTLPTDLVPSFKAMMKSCRFTEFLYKDSDKKMYKALKELSALCTAGEINSFVYKGLAYYILGLLTESLKTEPYPDSKRQTFSRDVLIYLQENFMSADITLDSTAKQFGYSKSRFSHIFTATFGYTFYEYLTLLRCRGAAAMIINDNTALIDAAMSCGFENIRTFYRAFKKTFDKTPTQYAKENTQFNNY